MDLFALVLLAMPAGSPAPYCTDAIPFVKAWADTLDAPVDPNADWERANWQCTIDAIRNDIVHARTLPSITLAGDIPDAECTDFRRDIAYSLRETCHEMALWQPWRASYWHGEAEYFDKVCDCYRAMNGAADPARSRRNRREKLAEIVGYIGWEGLLLRDWPSVVR